MFHSLACQLHLIAGKCHWVVHGGTANLVHNLKGSTCSTRVSSHCLPLWHTNQVSKSRIQDQNDIKMLQNVYIYDNVYVIDHNCIRFGHFPWRKARSEVFHSCLHAAIKCISCCQHEIVNVKLVQHRIFSQITSLMLEVLRPYDCKKVCCMRETQLLCCCGQTSDVFTDTTKCQIWEKYLVAIAPTAKRIPPFLLHQPARCSAWTEEGTSQVASVNDSELTHRCAVSLNYALKR